MVTEPGIKEKVEDLSTMMNTVLKALVIVMEAIAEKSKKMRRKVQDAQNEIYEAI